MLLDEKELLKNIIPKGLRCFEIMGIIDFNASKAELSFCPYWKNLNDETFKCSFLGIECEYGDENIKLWDCEKECNVNIYSKSSESKICLNS